MVGPTHQETQIFLYENVDEYNNQFGKGWSPGYELMSGAKFSTLPTLKLVYQTTPSSKMIYLKLL